MTKKAILVVSFGTTYVQARQRAIAATEKAVQDAFPKYDVFRAFTSKIVRQRIKEHEDIAIDDPATALKKLAERGYQEVAVLSLHFIPGIEYDLLQGIVEQSRGLFKSIRLTKPLLDCMADFQRMVDFLRKQSDYLPADKAVLWMGHGTAASAFTTYACLDHMLRGSKSFVGAVESYPDVEAEIPRLQAAKISKAFIQPLMLVAGNHAHNDMARTWKGDLQESGITARPILKGLGEYPEIQQMFIDKLKSILEGGSENG